MEIFQLHGLVVCTGVNEFNILVHHAGRIMSVGGQHQQKQGGLSGELDVEMTAKITVGVTASGFDLASLSANATASGKVGVNGSKGYVDATADVKLNLSYVSFDSFEVDYRYEFDL